MRWILKSSPGSGKLRKTEEFAEEGCEKCTALVERGTAEQVSQKVTEVRAATV